MPFNDAQDRLGALAIAGEMAEPFWNAVRGNIDKLSDAVMWWKIVQKGPLERIVFSRRITHFWTRRLISCRPIPGVLKRGSNGPPPSAIPPIGKARGSLCR
jgi:hypothetical protein